MADTYRKGLNLQRLPQQLCSYMETRTLSFTEIMVFFVVLGISSGAALFDYAVAQNVRLLTKLLFIPHNNLVISG